MPKINPVDILPFLAECFPHAFTCEKYWPHLPLKIGIDGDLVGRCPAMTRSERTVALRYTSRLALPARPGRRRGPRRSRWQSLLAL